MGASRGSTSLLPVALLIETAGKALCIHRSRHLLLRVAYGYYHRYLDAFAQNDTKGFWTQQYNLLSNRMHEINRLYDAFHERTDAVVAINRIYGYDLPPVAYADPALQAADQRAAPLLSSMAEVQEPVAVLEIPKALTVHYSRPDANARANRIEAACRRVPDRAVQII